MKFLPVLPPDINASFGGFTIVKRDVQEIRFGLYTIKNLGTDISNSIIEEREKMVLELYRFPERTGTKI